MVHPLYRRSWAFVALLALSQSSAAAGVSFKVSMPKDASAPISGRVVVLLVKDEPRAPRILKPIEGPFWDSQEPLFGADVIKLAPGDTMTLDDSCTAFPMKPSELSPGTYRAQARLVTQRQRSEWRQCHGSWSSDSIEFQVAAGTPTHEIALALTRESRVTPDIGVGRVSFIKVQSKLLAEFYHHPVELTVGIVSPLEPVPDHK